MNTGSITNLYEVIDPGAMHVHAPTKVVMLCGGAYDITDHVDGVKRPASSFRDAFYRSAAQPPFSKFRIVVPDDIVFGAPTGPYDQLLHFERDLAQLCEVVILFTESPGSFAELGAFSMVSEIAQRLLVFIDSKNYGDRSFIKLGPIVSLQLGQSRHSVFVMPLDELRIRSIQNVSDLDIDTFKAVIESPFLVRVQEVPTPSTFNSSFQGHMAKLVAGLIHHFGALTADEVMEGLAVLGLGRSLIEVRQLLFCLSIVGWVIEDPRGFETYYAASTDNAPFSFKVRAGSSNPSRKTWRYEIRDYWRQNDPQRFAAIASAASESLK